MEKRTKTDTELQEIADSYNESERFGSQFALFPHDKSPDNMTTSDTVRLMELCKKLL